MDAADYIQKPFDLERLLTAVRAHTHDDETIGSRATSPSYHATH
jgi:DNA-binding response OmpR family regulator